MSTPATLCATLRTHLRAAAQPGLAGVRALTAAQETLDQLEDAVRLLEQRGATREAARYGVMLRVLSRGDAAAVYEAEQEARAAHPDLWASRFQPQGGPA